jgi:hypothetical protein
MDLTRPLLSALPFLALVACSSTRVAGAQVSPPDPAEQAFMLAGAPCATDPSREAPVATGDLGTGSRTIELLNTGKVEIQARLLGGDALPAVQGTLRLPGQGRGVFHVPVGTYQLRLRDNLSCQVQRGTPFTIGEEHAGVSIALTPIFAEGEHHGLRDVDEAL